jgi:8-oxo-dGTP diphosphatase
VVAAVIRRQGRFLLGRRPQGKRHAGLWEFPGGKVRPGEDWLGASRRELAEELGMSAVSAGAVLHEAIDPDSPYVIHFVEVEATGEPTPVEHSEVGWFGADEVAAMELAPADDLFWRTLTKKASRGE